MAYDKDCCYEEMTSGKVHELSEVPCHYEKYENAYESKMKSSKGFDQSGMRSEK